MNNPPSFWEDITAGSAVTLLPGGWHAPMFDSGRTLRCVDHDAAFCLPAGVNPRAYVEVDVEPAADMGHREMLLRVWGNGDEQCISVSRRQMLILALPMRLKSESRYVMHAEGGGCPSANGDRHIAFRVFRLANRADIVTLQSGVDLLDGWEAMTEEDGERRRVARTGAKLLLHAMREYPVLVADVDPGPAPAAAGLRIDLCGEGGKTLFTTAIQKRQVVLMRLAIAAGTSGPFALHYDWIGRPAPAPPVLRAFRLSLH